MTIYLIVEQDDETGPMNVAAYLREELAEAAREKLGTRTHAVESLEVMDA